MQEIIISILGKVPTFQDTIVAVLTLIGALCVFATTVVKLTPSKVDDKYVDNFTTGFFALMARLPTFGINPQTKKLQEAYDELKAKTDDDTKVS